ncbi:MAG: DNA-primase RepB domain-containing protein [Gammaproteobacteria bacterium]|nr:DNA-primase RepB domain-containing protein [Gammaproteobacteria bacterium]
MSSRAGRPDLPARELARQIRALPAPRYEFAVFDGRTTRRLWRAKLALRSVGWLAHRNSRGGHVHVRPVTTACVLVDGLTAEALAAIRADGLAPAAVVESAPAAFQAWFRLGREPGPRLAACAAQVLAARYRSGPAAVDAAGLGRAAGFMNRTAGLRSPDGRYPRVLLEEARGRVTPGADELLAAAEERLLLKEKERRARGRGKASPCGGSAERAESALAREIARLAKRHGAATDWSRAFSAAAGRLARAGFAREQVAAALAACPAVQGRKGERAPDYAERTAAWAFGAVRRRPR